MSGDLVLETDWHCPVGCGLVNELCSTCGKFNFWAEDRAAALRARQPEKGEEG